MADPAEVESTGAKTFTLPPRHRLFAIFDEPEAGRRAIDKLRSEGTWGEDDIWVFYGDDGRRRLRGEAHRARRIAARLLQAAMSSDAYYLAVLDEALSEGGLVVALKAHDETSAGRLAGRLRAAQAHSFAYGAHWDFVPVSEAA
jgi:hypothetical protein